MPFSTILYFILYYMTNYTVLCYTIWLLYAINSVILYTIIHYYTVYYIKLCYIIL